MTGTDISQEFRLKKIKEKIIILSQGTDQNELLNNKNIRTKRFVRL